MVKHSNLKFKGEYTFLEATYTPQELETLMPALAELNDQLSKNSDEIPRLILIYPSTTGNSIVVLKSQGLIAKVGK